MMLDATAMLERAFADEHDAVRRLIMANRDNGLALILALQTIAMNAITDLEDQGTNQAQWLAERRTWALNLAASEARE